MKHLKAKKEWLNKVQLQLGLDRPEVKVTVHEIDQVNEHISSINYSREQLYEEFVRKFGLTEMIYDDYNSELLKLKDQVQYSSDNNDLHMQEVLHNISVDFMAQLDEIKRSIYGEEQDDE